MEFLETTKFQFLPIFFTMFMLIYLTAYLIVFRNWSSKTRPEASSCLISLFHGTPAVFMSVYAIHVDPDRSFASQNTESQNTVLEFSIAYFLTDLVHFLVFCPNDIMFIAHHLATLFVFLTCRYIVLRGAYAILVLLALAEVTSFCQNVWTLAGVRRSDVKFAARAYGLLSPPFYAFYSVVRGFAGPLFVYEMGKFFLSGKAEGVIPNWVWISWMVVVVLAISVSILWVANLWIEFFRERKGRLGKKLR